MLHDHASDARIATRSLVFAAAATATFVAYVTMALVGIALPVGQGVVSPVWVPAGIAVAAVVVLGLRLWPVIFAAAFVGNLLGGSGLLLAAGVSVTSTLEPILAALLMRRLGLRPALDRGQDVRALLIAAPVACAFGAIWGASFLVAADAPTVADLPSLWLLWWSGDLSGMLLVAPALLTSLHAIRDFRRPTVARVLEFVLVMAIIVAVAWIVFANEEARRPGLLLPAWAWAAIRFRALGATVAWMIISVFGVAGAITGTLGFPDASATVSVQLMHLLLTATGLSLLAVATAVSERDDARRRAEAALVDEQAVARELRRLDELKDRLLAAVSHELRTPLTSILALATLLQDQDATLSSEKRREMHGRVELEARRLDTLLTDLLDVERVRMGRNDARREPVDVAALVRDVLDRRDVSDRTIDRDLRSVTVPADRVMVERIVDNLVTNAHRHTPSDRSLAVRVLAADGGALVVVEDDGDGVADADKAGIFEPFQRATSNGDGDGSAAVEHGVGHGLGLALVLQFAELHGGRAWVEDRAGGGASFRVFLPGASPVDQSALLTKANASTRSSTSVA